MTKTKLLEKGIWRKEFGERNNVMAKVSTNISLDAEDKVKAQEFLAAVGMDLSTAVGVFIKQMLREGRIPFEIRGEIPNKETLSAMEECEEMKKTSKI